MNNQNELVNTNNFYNINVIKNKMKYFKIFTFVVYIVLFLILMLITKKPSGDGSSISFDFSFLIPFILSSILTGIYQIIHFIIILGNIPQKNRKSIIGNIFAYIISLILPIILLSLFVLFVIPLVVLYIFSSSISDENDSIKNENTNA